MNVLSLFDGISCGRLALERAGVKYDNYYSSEIDYYAIKIAQKNYPNTIQLGDVCNIRLVDLPEIDLLIGGSPCQGFSIAGSKLNFTDHRSVLFFEFVRLMKVKPKHFLLENVKMKKEWRDIISEYLEVEPIEINSNLASAQNRKRLYWTNIPGITQPVDKKIFLKDVLEKNIGDVEFEIPTEIVNKCDIERFRNTGVSQVMFTERRTEEAKRIRREYQQLYKRDFCPRRAKELIPRTDNKSNCLTTSLTKEHILLDESQNFRYLTPLECERLQTLPDNYTELEGISNNQRYKMIGNGWTVDVIAHILSFI
ncbi:MAG: DNA (cytosine-5-)-methyltransferase [Dehalococcoidia bacterium]|jgi:DNA (cytosine-5)-methyltransferase 3A